MEHFDACELNGWLQKCSDYIWLFGGLLLVLATTTNAATITGRVVRVADGDTLTVLDVEHQEHKIRLADIDAPEIGHGKGKPGQPYGTNAREALAGLCAGYSASVEVRNTDRYGRSVGVVVCNGKDANLEMVRGGFAWAYVRYNARADISRSEQEARAARRGLWVDASPMPPWEWRRGMDGDKK
jgi:endonuclease YncB( thermonuclease family)